MTAFNSLQVMVGNANTNQTQVLDGSAQGSPILAMAANITGTDVVSGDANGFICR